MPTKPLRLSVNNLQKRLAGRYGLPWDLKHVASVFATVIALVSGNEGLLWLFVVLKLPSARGLWLKKWKSSCRQQDVIARVFLALAYMAEHMASTKYREQERKEVRSIGGPLHAHGYLSYLVWLHVVKKVPRGTHGAVQLGTTGNSYKILKYNRKAGSEPNRDFFLFCSVFCFAFFSLGGPGDSFGAPGCGFFVVVAVVTCHDFYYY